MDKVRIGVLSHAHGHSNTYCRKMLGFEDVELVACWDDNEQRGTGGRRRVRHGVPRRLRGHYC